MIIRVWRGAEKDWSYRVEGTAAGRVTGSGGLSKVAAIGLAIEHWLSINEDALVVEQVIDGLEDPSLAPAPPAPPEPATPPDTSGIDEVLQKKVDRLELKGRQAWQKGDYEQAARLFKEAAIYCKGQAKETNLQRASDCLARRPFVVALK